jgi:phage shock protein B
MVLCIPLAAIIGGCVISALKILKGDSTQRDKQSHAQETRLIQEIHHGLSRMEERVEALETILLDREKKGDDK